MIKFQMYIATLGKYFILSMSKTELSNFLPDLHLQMVPSFFQSSNLETWEWSVILPFP